MGNLGNWISGILHYIDVFYHWKNYPNCLHAVYALSELFVRGNKIARPFIERINDYILNGKHAGQYALAF